MKLWGLMIIVVKFNVPDFGNVAPYVSMIRAVEGVQSTITLISFPED